MEQRMSIITLGADNLQELKKFYVEKFQWKIEAEAKDIVFFKLNGLLLGLYGKKDLAAFVGSTTEKGSGFRAFTLAYMVQSKAEVEKLYNELKFRGVRIVKEPEVPPIGGYYFLLADSEGNIWEIAYNTFMILDEKGNVIAHKNIDTL
jgi:catechol 2,3-dioxygenase-like lactoylglutathione lyase family enzyme